MFDPSSFSFADLVIWSVLLIVAIAFIGGLAKFYVRRKNIRMVDNPYADSEIARTFSHSASLFKQD